MLGHPTWYYIERHCSTFLVDDMYVCYAFSQRYKLNSIKMILFHSSKDDPFIIYAALHGGPNTNIITHDMLRNHAYLLGPEMKPVFQRWQQKHQYNIADISPDGILKLQPSIQYNVYGHKNNGIWHIPFMAEFNHKVTELYAYNMPEQWACFQL